MQPELILYSLLIMFLFSVAIGIRLLQLRIRAVYRDKVPPAYFKLNKGAKIPDYLVQVTQHYENLYETPVLFYVIVILAYVLKLVDPVTLALAYGYVITRMLHAWIHLNSNRILRRRNIFLVSILVLTALWLYVFVVLMLRG